MRVQVDERGQRQALRLAVQLEVHRELRRDGTLQLAPRVAAADVQGRGQRFLGLAHQVLALLGGLPQDEGVAGCGWVGRNGFPQDRTELSDPGLQPGGQVLQADG